MKKIINKFLIFITIFISIFTSINDIYASGKVINEASGWYFERADKNGNKNFSGTLKDYYIDGEVAYCIEPGAPDASSLDETNWSKTGLSSDIKKRILLIGYYGYSYPGHKTKKYRAATQCMMWETILGSGSWCKINTKRWSSGDNIDISFERKEINRLISEHSKTLSFDGEVYKLQVGETISLTDENKMLSNFEIIATDVDYQIKDNIISLKPKTDSSNIYFEKRQVLSSNYKIFTSDSVQNMIVPGNIDPIIARIKLNSYYGNIEVIKKDSEIGSAQGNATLKGAIYGIYDKETNELITTITTNENGIATSDNILEYKEYILKEITPSTGYLLDEKEYQIDARNHEKIKLEVLENVIKAKVEIIKLFRNANTKTLNPEIGTKFALYDSNDNLIEEFKTDKDGKFEMILPFGKYKLSQLTTKNGYKFVDDYEFEINSEETLSKTLINEEVTARLKLVKIDRDTNEVIKRANIKFKIFSIDKNEYVCQKVTFPKEKMICEYETDENGVMVTPTILYSGKYKVEEVDQKIDGYTWNKESVEFTIDENSNLINDNEYGILFETKFENTRVKGKLEIKKIGEELIYNELGYKYKEIPLEGVEFGIFQNNNLIGIYKTNENGMITIEDLELGSYVIKELSTVKGHVLADNEYEIEIKYMDQYTETVNYKLNLKNYLPKGTLEFTKTDISKSTTLPNTLIEIYVEGDDKLIFSGRTDKNGMIVIKNLPINKYYLVEKEAPEGYTLNTEKMYFEIRKNGEIIKCSMEDEQIIKVPITYLNDYKISIIIGILLVCAGVGVVVYEKKRQNR